MSSLDPRSLLPPGLVLEAVEVTSEMITISARRDGSIGQPQHLRRLQAATLGLPVVQRLIADPVLPAQIRRRMPRLMLLQDPQNLPLG